MRVDTARACLVATPGMASELDVILNAVDADYFKLWHDVINSTALSVYAKQLKSVFSDLSVDDNLVYIADCCSQEHTSFGTLDSLRHLQDI